MTSDTYHARCGPGAVDRAVRGYAVSTSQVANISEMSWRLRGACNGLDPAIFYPETEDKEDVAVAICAECAVRTMCLEYAVNRREKDGIWGGATERERRRIVRQRRRIA